MSSQLSAQAITAQTAITRMSISRWSILPWQRGSSTTPRCRTRLSIDMILSSPARGHVIIHQARASNRNFMRLPWVLKDLLPWVMQRDDNSHPAIFRSQKPLPTRDRQGVVRVSSPRSGANHEVIIGVFAHLEPEIFLVAEGAVRIIDLLELGIFARGLVIKLIRGFVRRLHDLLGERPELRARADKAAQSRRVAGIVFGEHVDISVGGRRRGGRLVGFRQFVPFRLVKEEAEHRATLPPSGVIVERRDLVEAELLVVVGADP